MNILLMIVLGLTLFSGFMVIMQNHPVRSVLFLVLTFFCSAVLWLMLEAEFLSLILLLVYVGAVMTLFLFVVMMLSVDVEAMRSHLWRLLPLGAVMVGGWSFLFARAFLSTPLAAQLQISLLPATSMSSNTVQIGDVLYTTYVYPFELAAVILLIAMVAAITLVHRHVQRSKRQDIRAQIMTDAKARVKLVAIPTQPEASV